MKYALGRPYNMKRLVSIPPGLFSACLWSATHLLYICRLVPSTAANPIDFPLPPPDGASGSLISAACAQGTCRNGQCYIVGRTARCYCPKPFRGTRCEHVNLNQVTFSVIGSMVIFQWVHPPRLSGYSFVYYELDSPDSFMYKTDIAMDDNENAVLVGNLKGGHTMYRICIEDELLADKVVNQDAVEYLTNCVNLSTQPDYHTLVAWCIAAMLACVAVLVIYFQKDKFELLYFTSPAFLMPTPPMTDPVTVKDQQSDDVIIRPVCNHIT